MRMPEVRVRADHAGATAATTRQLRILHVINSTRPEGGGPIEAIRQATAAMAARGHLTEIACLDVHGDRWLAEVPAKVHPLGPTRTGFRYSPRLVPWLRANRHKYDCAIVHGIWLFPTYGTWRALRGTSLPYFVYTHGSLDPAHRDVMPGKHAKKMLVWMSHERRVLRDARAVFFTCEIERDLARNSFWPALGEVDNVIVPYCVASPPADVARQTAAFRQRFAELFGKRLVLFLSRLDPKKGADLLIRAFADVKNGDPDAHLVMAGSGEPQYEAELKVMASGSGLDGRITWTGMLTGDLKWGAFREADAFALISHQENYGIAVVEALGCGVPVLTSDKVNIWPAIEKSHSGLVGRDNFDSARDMLSCWLTMSAADRDACRRNARACFKADFSVERAADLLERTLLEHCPDDRKRQLRAGELLTN